MIKKYRRQYDQYISIRKTVLKHGPGKYNRHPGRSEAESGDPGAFEIPGFPLSRE
jgi:hypothetical protein